MILQAFSPTCSIHSGDAAPQKFRGTSLEIAVRGSGRSPDVSAVEGIQVVCEKAAG
jgi:hypothetical protein